MKKSSSSLTMDGFVNSHSSYRGGGSKIPKITEHSNLFKSQAVKSKLKSTAQNVHKRTQRSHTLMRAAVNKPSETQEQSSEIAQPKVKLQHENVNKVRNTRVQSIVKHTNVKRFGHAASPTKSQINKTVSVGEVMAKPQTNRKQTPRVLTHNTATAAGAAANVSSQHLERLLDEALTKADAHKKSPTR